MTLKSDIESKQPLKKPLKDNGEPLVNNDAEAETVVAALVVDVDDLVDILADKDYQEALDSLQSIQEGIDALHAYLADKE